MNYTESGLDSQDRIVFRVAQEDAPKFRTCEDMYEALREALITMRILQPNGSAVLRQMTKALAKAEGK